MEMTVKISRPNETVEEHLTNVSNECGRMCAKFGMMNFGRIVGMCHDAYKDSDAWQKYLKAKLDYQDGLAKELPETVNHAPESAIYLAWRLGKAMKSKPSQYAQLIAEAMAQCVISHHSGLHDMNGGEGTYVSKVDSVFVASDGTRSFAETKQELLSRTGIDFSTVDDSLFDSVFEPQVVDAMYAEFMRMVKSHDGEIFLRMVYSCLVDADRLDAELKGDGGVEKAETRKDFDGLDKLLGMFMEHIRTRIESAPNAKERINVLRTQVRNEVAAKAHGGKGIYNLVLPTGVGKTLTGMQFALEHAVFHGMDRVIVLAPLTTVVDQTAMTYTEIFTDRNVVEHQCDFDVLDKVKKSEGKTTKGFNNDENEIEKRMALTTENWNVPIVVSTTVQFFESLLKSRSGSSRKIHNIANSVIIVDEEQQLPTHQLYPILHTLNCLVRDFGCTVVRSTATLPAFDGKMKVASGKYVQGYDYSVDLVGNVNALFGEFKRADVVFVGNKNSDEIAEELADAGKSCLCVVNTRGKCRKLFEKVKAKKANTFMLSKDICPKDRKRMVKEVTERLKGGDKITVVATSLVEAGVDFDFDAAWREMNSLYSIYQTRGRCNRNGRLTAAQIFVFEFSDMPVMKFEDAYQKAEVTRNCLADGQLPAYMGEHDICLNYSRKAIYNEGKKIEESMTAYEEAAVYTQQGTDMDRGRVNSRFFDYCEYGMTFNMIDDTHRGFPVVVKYREDEEDTAVDQLLRDVQSYQNKFDFRKLLRKIQQYVVEVNKKDAERLDSRGFLEELFDYKGESLGLYVLRETDYEGKTMYAKGKGVIFENCDNSVMIL